MKKSFVLFLIFLIGFQLFPSFLLVESKNIITFYEAEKAEFITDRENKKDESASGGEAVFLPYGNANGVEPYCKFTFNIERAGFYNLSINSWGSGDEKKNYIDIDSTRLNNVYLLSPKDQWKEHTFIENQYFEEGKHSVTVTAGYGYTYLDYLKVELISELSTSDIYNKKYELSNKNATTRTKELFTYLQKSYGKYILSGQFIYEGLNDPALQRIKEKTGKLPALLGLDLLAVTPSIKELSKYWIPYPDFDKVIDTAIQYSEQGGIISFSWHWNLDFSFMKKDENGDYVNAWSAYRPAYVNIDLKKVMADENSPEYKLLERDMDAVAMELKRLSDKDIPILFRPLHEASGEWFWWSTGGEEAYIKLWRKMYDKFTNEYKLNNLIWVWNGDNAKWYPGDEYVDICGADIYSEKKDYNAHSLDFKRYMGYSNNKMLTLSEIGTLFDIDEAFRNNTVWSWFMNWTGIHTIPEIDNEDAYTSLEMWNKVYNHEKVITLDELPFHIHSDTNADNKCDICGIELPKNTDQSENQGSEGSNNSTDNKNDQENSNNGNSTQTDRTDDQEKEPNGNSSIVPSPSMPNGSTTKKEEQSYNPNIIQNNNTNNINNTNQNRNINGQTNNNIQSMENIIKTDEGEMSNVQYNYSSINSEKKSNKSDKEYFSNGLFITVLILTVIAILKFLLEKYI